MGCCGNNILTAFPVMGGKTMKYAVVGFGTAGYHAVKKIRELDKEGCIDVYSNTGRAP